MKQTFSMILKCPRTGKKVSWHRHMAGSGLCVHCGDVQPGTMSHAKKVPVETFTPSILEWLKGQRKVSIEMGDDE